MATFYIQLENRLLQISGELTAENISKALGYVPVSPNVTNELSQRVDNITFDSLKDNPFLQDGSGELNIVDEAGNIIAKIDADGIHSVDFIAGEHRLSNKTDKTYVDEAVKNVKVDLTGYATEEYVNNIDFYNIKDNPIVNNGDGKLLFVDENGYIGLQLEEDGLYVKDVIADGHTLSQKANKSELPTKTSDLTNDSGFITINDVPVLEIPEEYITETELNDKGFLTEHQDISHLASKDDVYDSISNIDFYSIKDNPVINSETGKLLFVDESGNIGLQLEDSGLFVADVFAGSHVLSNKADKSEVPTSTSQLTNDSGYITKPVVDQAIASLVDSAPETLDTIGEIASALKNNADIVDVLNQSISTKQNTIEDLDAIRAGAVKGATALQEIPEEYAKKEDIPSLNGYATQAWVNSNNYATEEDLSSIEFNSLQNNPLVEDSNGEFNLVDDLGNVGFKVNQEGLFVKDVIAGEHILSNKADKTYIDNLELDELNAILVDTDAEADDPIVSEYITENELATALSSKMDKVTLSKVATSGSYNDLSNKPTIPAAVTENTVSGWGFTKNTGTYSKPSGGIPKSDLASAVQTSLGKADTALQSHQDISGKQDKLVSGTNIKTINGESIVGSGDITISGGGSSSGSGAYSEVNHGTSDTTFTLTPNTFHIWDEVSSLTLTLGSETTGIANEYLFQFKSGAIATTLSLPSDLKWANDAAPVIVENMIYQVSILKGLASVLEFSNINMIDNHITASETDTIGYILQYPNASELTISYYGPYSTVQTLTLPIGSTSFQCPSGKSGTTRGDIISITPSNDNQYNYIIS